MKKKEKTNAVLGSLYILGILPPYFPPPPLPPTPLSIPNPLLRFQKYFKAGKILNKRNFLLNKFDPMHEFVFAL